MHALTYLAVALRILAPQAGPELAEAHLEKVRAAARTGSFENLKPLFNKPTYTAYLEAMIERPAALRTIAIDAFPAPPGYESFGAYWLAFHRYQASEANHDAVFPIIPTGDGVSTGAEMPEDIAVPYKLEDFDFNVKLYPNDRRASIETACKVTRVGSGPTTVLMRMNDAFVVKTARFAGKQVEILSNKPLSEATLSPSKLQLVQSGGVLYLTNAGEGGKLELSYTASLDIPGLDKTTEDSALLTSYWYPHIGRRPAKSRTRIEGPKDWLLVSNGNIVRETAAGARKTVEYKNDVPLSWFHVVGGKYELAHEVEDRGRKFRAWHVAGSVEKERGKHDAEMARDSVAFFEDRFGKFPYNGYDVVDTPDFYGIECYSFTILTPRITSWATSHEVGHTYFGGLAPNTYIHSIWNESVTQYVDSVQFKNNSDHSLESGYQSRKTQAPLATIFHPHGRNGLIGYMRGAFVLKMLENEIGLDTTNRCLRELVKERNGLKTEWSDIERTFSRVSGKQVGWFWDQWIRGSSFPTVTIGRVLAEPGPRGGFNTNIVVTQQGTPAPFRLRFEVVLQTITGDKRFPVLMDRATKQYDLETDARPTSVRIDPMGWTLADVPSEAAAIPPPWR